MRKKENKTNKTINNIGQLNVEIDYDKLASAIISAQEKAKKKDIEHSKIRIKTMKFFNGSIYIGIAIFTCVVIYKLWCSTNDYSISTIIFNIVISVLLAAIAIFMFFSQQESFDDSFEETKFHFNTNISLIAMIIALLALYHEIR